MSTATSERGDVPGPLTRPVRFSFGFGVDCSDLDEFCRIARAADDAGVAMVGTGDTPALLGDCYVGMALIAQNTTRCRVTSWVTNPVTRHPVVMAAAASTVDALSGGRVVLGMSSGDSGVYNLGKRPATIAQMEEAVRVLRELWEHGESRFDGETVKLTWAHRKLPIYLAPGGPRGLRLAGRVADGVYIEAGLLPEVAEAALGHVRAGAAEAGRSIDEIDIWWHVRACLAESKEAAAYRLRSPLAGIANRSIRFSEEGKMIPEALLPKFRELKARYDIAHHEEHGAHLRNGPLLDELGLRDYLVERYSLAGNAQDWVDRITELQARGISQFALAVMVEDKLDFLQTLATDVMPRVCT
jgi:5,10-methylenetetrahydromethanopterin reductase